MASLSDDLEARLNHLRVPINHRRYVPTTNLIERSFLEERRRAKIILRFFETPPRRAIVWGGPGAV
jgi:putative transposase